MNHQKQRLKHSPWLLEGQAIAEYLVLTALIAIGSLAIVQILGGNIQKRLAEVSDAIAGKRSHFRGEHAKEKQYRTHDMGDFTSALRDNSESAN